jgi:hypothetical protein
MVISRFKLGFLAFALCLALANCGLPPQESPQKAAEDAEFNAKFGIPGSVPLQPIRPRGVLEIVVDKVFGDPSEKPQLIKAPPKIPEPKLEPIPRAPRGGAYVWQPSAWEWNGYAFVWVLGRWVQPPPELHWESGHWTLNDVQVWIWITGGWVA